MTSRNAKMLTKAQRGVVAFAIVAALGVAPTSALGLGTPGASAQTERAAGEPARHFRSGRSWDACGVLPYEGWQGCLNFDSVEYLSSDGATLVYSEASCTSDDAASAELETWLASSGAPGTGYRVLNRRSVGEGLIVERDVPSTEGAGDEGKMFPTPGRYVYYWLAGASVRGISGPSEVIVLELFAANPDKHW